MKFYRPLSLCGIVLVMVAMLIAYDRVTADRSVLSMAQADPIAVAAAEARWVVDPAEPGPDLPPVGRSLFDHVITEQQGPHRGYRVPFPFTALVQKVEQELDPADRGSPLKRVLIPLNRSLQRHAAGPDYFTYPRAIVAVDTEPRMRAGSSGLLLKDRLFLGYQEKAEILEVISYNEAAGRFEFQVVRDYGPGKTPRVLYANRALCTACHQNHSPIFSRPLWDETNANPNIAALLERQRRDFYRFPVHQGVDVPNAIDEATDRANEFSAYQLFWQDGCERARSPSESIQCRADLFRVVLQARLTGFPPALNRSPLYRKQWLPRIAAQWSEKWPHGLKLPNPDLLNRNPVEETVGERARMRAVFEPTSPREPSAVWPVLSAAPDIADRIITGLSGFLADGDVKRLDRFLARQTAGPDGAIQRFHSRCEADVRNNGRTVDRVIFRCRKPQDREEDRSFSMEAVLYMKAGTVTSGTIDRLSTGRGDEAVGLKVVGGTAASKAGRHSGRMTVAQKERGLHGRLADGRRIKDVMFEVHLNHGHRAVPTEAAFPGSAVMTVVEDTAAVQRAIDTMARETLAGQSDVFGPKPFRRAGLMKTLWRQLGMPPLEWCCEDAAGMPDAVAMTDRALHDRDGAGHDKDLPPVFKAFHRYCAQCHHEDLPFPPNFLHGSPARVQAQIEHCAERIVFRLEMWSLAPHGRPEAPMPPATALQRLDLSPQQWADHRDLALLKSYSAGLVAAEGGRPGRFETLTAKGYGQLRTCLPSAEPTVVGAVAQQK